MNELNQWNVNESDPCHLRAWPTEILSMPFSMLSFFLLAGRMETTPIKAMYENPTTNIIFNSRRLKGFLLLLRPKQRCSLSPLLFSIVLDILARVTRQERETKGIQTEKVNLSLFTDIISRVKSLKITHKKTVIRNEFSKVAGYKVNMKNLITFLYMNNLKRK